MPQKSSIIIRRLKAADPDLGEIASRLNTADSEVSIKAFSAESLRSFLNDPKRHYVIAYRDGELAGAVHGYELMHPAGVTYLYIDEVDTIASHRRYGVATALMKEFFQIAQQQGVNEVWLGTEHDNDAANALYKSLKPSETEHGPIYSFKIPR